MPVLEGKTVKNRLLINADFDDIHDGDAGSTEFSRRHRTSDAVGTGWVVLRSGLADQSLVSRALEVQLRYGRHLAELSWARATVRSGVPR